MSGKDDIIPCSVTGKCAIHDVDVERRGAQDRATDKRIDGIATSHKEFKSFVYRQFEKLTARLDGDGDIAQKLDLASMFRSRAQIVGVIALLIFGASFLYTQLHISRSDRRFELRKLEVKGEFDMRKADMEKKYELLAGTLKAETDKFHRLINITEDRVDALEIEIRLTTDRYQRIISDIGRVEKMLTAMMEATRDAKEHLYDDRIHRITPGESGWKKVDPREDIPLLEQDF